MTQLCNSCDKLTYIVMTNFIYCDHLSTKMGQQLNAVHESEMLTDHHEEENETKSVVHIRKLLKI